MSRFLEWSPLRSLPAPGPEAESLRREFAPLVGGRAACDTQSRVVYARDLWVRSAVWARAGRGPVPPDLVLWPESVDEVVAVTRRALALGVPLVPYGGGTGLAGGVQASRGGITLDLKRMARVFNLDAESAEADVEAGIRGEVLERRLNRHGFTTGHFPGSMRASTLGGWIATRAEGLGASRHGAIEERLASLTAVDGRGEVLVTPRRPYAGWNPTALLAGSEGCLATICSARLQLVRLPEARSFLAVEFANVATGLEALRALVRAGLSPSGARLCDPLDTLLLARSRKARPAGRRNALRERLDEGVFFKLERVAARALGARPLGLNLAAELLRRCLLLLVFEGPADLCELEAEEAARVCATAGGDDQGPEPARDWWERRYDEGYLRSPLFDAGTLAVELEASATWDRALAVYERVRAELSGLALVGGRVAHAWPEGCALGFRFLAAAGGPVATEERYEEIERRAFAAVKAAGGALQARGGVGIARLPALKSQLGDGTRLLRALKATFDPSGILNPGKLGT